MEQERSASAVSAVAFLLLFAIEFITPNINDYNGIIYNIS